MVDKIPIAIARGDGIGPEIMAATLSLLQAVEAPLEYHEIEIGEKLYLQGHTSGIDDSAWKVLFGSKALLKAPITTPLGGGYKSVNVQIRSALGLFANTRPCLSYYPYVMTKHPVMDLIIVRENEEDLYCGIEYRSSPDAYHAIKIISTMGSEKIVRYAFEYAKAAGRKKVTCFTKDNILKMSDGHFHKIFEKIALEYPSIENEHFIVDIGAAKLADTPELFDVLVLPNLYGDILSDVAAEISGSIALGASANIGDRGAMFEAVHGSAPKLAGRDVANPSALILASVQLLHYLNCTREAMLIHNAFLKTIEEGIHTYDIYSDTISKQKVGTRAFTQAILARLGKAPAHLKAASYKKLSFSPISSIKSNVKREVVGVDIFVYHQQDLQSLLHALPKIEAFKLDRIFNRGAMVWPLPLQPPTLIEEYRLRFFSRSPWDYISSLKLDIYAIEILYSYEGSKGYSD